MIIRALRASDLAEVAHIEKEALPDPWSEELLVAELAVENGVSFAAEYNGSIRGYAFFRVCPPESELLRLAVTPAHRRQGIASTLLLHALRSFFHQGYETCFLEVRASNSEARHLYAHAGFVQAGVRKNYYRQPIEDALVLCGNLEDMIGGTP